MGIAFSEEAAKVMSKTPNMPHKFASLGARLAAGASVGGLAGTVIPEEPLTAQGIMLGALLGAAMPRTQAEIAARQLRRQKMDYNLWKLTHPKKNKAHYAMRQFKKNLFTL